MTQMMSQKPRWLAAPEVNFTNHWRARWIQEDAVPKDVPASHVYAILVMDGKGYAVRARGGEARWAIVEGAVPEGAKLESHVKQLVKERTGGTVGKLVTAGYLVCKATQHNPEFEGGTLRLRPVCVAVIKTMKDLGPDAPWERRRYQLNQYAQLLRHEYPIEAPYLREALDKYLVLQARGEA